MRYGLGNKVIPFKNRKIDLGKEVYLYRNLNRKGRIYSLKQNGLVVGYTEQLMMRNVRFVVGGAGQKRCRKTGKRNVHAYVKGVIAKNGGMGTDASDSSGLPIKITYNPFKNSGFVCQSMENTDLLVNRAWCAMVNSKSGLTASYVD